MSTRTPTKSTPPHPTDGPFLLALLIGAKRSGDKSRVQHARESLEEIGIRISFAKDSPALHSERKGGGRG